MELRNPERPEPSHIHVPRPSRAAAPVADESQDLAVVDCECRATPEGFVPWTRLN